MHVPSENATFGTLWWEMMVEKSFILDLHFLPANWQLKVYEYRDINMGQGDVDVDLDGIVCGTWPKIMETICISLGFEKMAVHGTL